MSREFQVRRYELGDEAGIVELLKQTFPDWAKRKAPVEYWRWKYLDCPHGSVIYIAVSDGKVIGCNHTILLKIKVGGKIFNGRYGDDAATNPDYRGMGVYSQVVGSTLKELNEKVVEVNYDVPISSIIVKDHLKRGRKIFPHTVSHLLRVKNVREYFSAAPIENAALKSYTFSALKGMKSFSNRLTTRPKDRGDYIISEEPVFDERINTFYDKIKDNLNFIVERNRDYLNWRYRDPQGGRITIKQVTEGEQILGYSVLQLKGEGKSSEGYITDLLAPPGREDVASTLLADACNYFDGAGVNALNYRVVLGHDYYGLASSMGFIDVRNNLPLMMDCSTDSVKAEFKLLEGSPPSKVHFTYGDYY